MASFISATVKVLVVSVTSNPLLSHSLSNYPPVGDMPDPKGGKGKKAGGAAAKGGKSAGAKSDFGAEYAVSGGSTCKGCAAKIAKGKLI